MKTPASVDLKPYTDCNAVRLPHVWQAGITTTHQWWDCLYCPVSTRTPGEELYHDGVTTTTYPRPPQYLPTAASRRMAEEWDRGIDHA